MWQNPTSLTISSPVGGAALVLITMLANPDPSGLSVTATNLYLESDLRPKEEKENSQIDRK